LLLIYFLFLTAQVVLSYSPDKYMLWKRVAKQKWEKLGDALFDPTNDFQYGAIRTMLFVCNSSSHVDLILEFGILYRFLS